MVQVMQQRDSSSSSESEDGGCCAVQHGDLKGPVAAQPAYIRQGFVRKVYSLLTMQLLLTIAIVYPIVTILKRTWVLQHMTLYYAASFGSLTAVLCVSCCCQSVARKFPMNYFFLFFVTVCMSITTGFLCTFYTISSVLQALTATALVFAVLTAFACCTNIDFTGCGIFLYAGLMAMIMYGFTVMIWSMFAPIPPWVKTLMGLLGVLLFSMYIVYDTQLIIGGRHKQHQFEVDEYVFAALNLYLDIINLFIYILQLLGSRE